MKVSTKRGQGTPNGKPTGSVKSPTVGKNSVTTRMQPTNRVPSGPSTKSIAGNW
jgi:hypothetical protein